MQSNSAKSIARNIIEVVNGAPKPISHLCLPRDQSSRISGGRPLARLYL